MMRLLRLCLPVIAGLLSAQAASRFSEDRSRGADWFSSPEGLQVTTNVLSWQSPEGSWPKNLDTSRKLYTDNPKSLHGTFDNGATTGELRFLARAFHATKNPACKAAVISGIDHILKAQYPSGGWPQSYPPGKGYPRHITFNDGAMVRLMHFLRDVANGGDFSFVDEDRRDQARKAFDRGIDCILKCQVIINGKRTVWCAQHDEVNYQPRPARTYELPSLSGSESVGVLELLMGLEHASPEVVRAVKAGVEWFESATITGIRVEKIDGERTLVKDPSAPPLWARFYDLKNGRPIFSNRDGVKRYDYMEVNRERRNGYSWYGDWGKELENPYSKWKAKWLRSNEAVGAGK